MSFDPRRHVPKTRRQRDQYVLARLRFWLEELHRDLCALPLETDSRNRWGREHCVRYDRLAIVECIKLVRGKS